MVAGFFYAISITSQTAKHFWRGVYTDFLYKNVTKDFAVNKNFIIYPSPSVAAIAALHHYYGLQGQTKRNKTNLEKTQAKLYF